MWQWFKVNNSVQKENRISKSVTDLFLTGQRQIYILGFGYANDTLVSSINLLLALLL